MGMYTVCYYPNFSTEDVGRFERRLTKWSKEACMHEKSMLIFDKETLKIKGENGIFVDNDLVYFKLTLPNITLAYTSITGTNMCIMYKIWENRTQSVLYQMPSKWEGTELWLGG